ncbi:hypothetical protein CEXT_635531 [Caerostris extrusa]|uniref:Uncharacterized protein n=1 Tax=Caerostris extrusa TaxID=172846 RepID=A0AAV4XNK3_CAEEX|nr:hypothetical protein CEXT_635531 [Caerostris extrusa]
MIDSYISSGILSSDHCPIIPTSSLSSLQHYPPRSSPRHLRALTMRGALSRKLTLDGTLEPNEATPLCATLQQMVKELGIFPPVVVIAGIIVCPQWLSGYSRP